MQPGDLVRQMGPVALFLLSLLETVGIPVPAEMTLLAAGYLAAGGHLSLPWAVAAAVAGCAVGSAASYRIGQVAGTGWLYRMARRLRIREEQVARTEAWFRQRGQAAVFLGRFLPFVRALVGYPAGMARMPFGRYMAFTLMGYGMWSTGSLLAGYLAGSLAGIERLAAYRDYADEALLVAAAVTAAWWLVRRRARARTQGTDPA